MNYFLQICQPNMYMNLYYLPNVLHARAIYFFIWLSEDYLARSTNREDFKYKSPVSHYEVSRSSLRRILLLIISHFSHQETSCFSIWRIIFSLWSFAFFIMKSPVTHHYISCFSLWSLLFINMKSPVSNYEVSCFSLWSFLLPRQTSFSASCSRISSTFVLP
jgi:hypothetical protein